MKYVKIGLQIFLIATVLSIVASCEKASAPEHDDSTQSLRAKVDDSVITAKVKAALFNNETIRSLNVSVATVDGVVTLNGVVDRPGQIDTCSALAMHVEGVKRVNNRLTVTNAERKDVPVQPGNPMDAH